MVMGGRFKYEALESTEKGLLKQSQLYYFCILYLEFSCPWFATERHEILVASHL